MQLLCMFLKNNVTYIASHNPSVTSRHKPYIENTLRIINRHHIVSSISHRKLQITNFNYQIASHVTSPQCQLSNRFVRYKSPISTIKSLRMLQVTNFNYQIASHVTSRQFQLSNRIASYKLSIANRKSYITLQTAMDKQCWKSMRKLQIA